MREILHCRTCGAEIVMLRHERTGKPAPIETTPSARGNILADLEAGTYRLLGKEAAERARAVSHAALQLSPALLLNHYATCPQATFWHKEARS